MARGTQKSVLPNLATNLKKIFFLTQIFQKNSKIYSQSLKNRVSVSRPIILNLGKQKGSLAREGQEMTIKEIFKGCRISKVLHLFERILTINMKLQMH